ncbi:hypothetical protein RhiXN_07612 [Rhizoctonia solani]|uniref:t-SNARE coiled-coil homology domain-containing protein n=1 Tax=Rhizoctonia solani TaxID=456999 RepID=A0A8H7H067_9AGAM|nr:uncharacterized protein RhiXN_07612 [Rhizoctonia solani]KAF8668041.1 hypothetical protein RHS04_09172 [Rhizoctonia solani]QRW22576.1 hypothetical protein RhiXN_07612 [Rhizoctonia solani]
MSSSRNQRDEALYESQNDTRLDDLHSKLRTLRHVTIDIHNDAHAQNRELDNTGNIFSSFQNSLSSSSQRAARAFGIGPGGVKQSRLILMIVAATFSLWVVYRAWAWWVGPVAA